MNCHEKFKMISMQPCKSDKHKEKAGDVKNQTKPFPDSKR